MKIKQFITVLATILILVGCTSEKDQYMNDWRQLIKTVETDNKLSEKELKNASDKYEQLNGKLTQYYNQLTPEERKEIGRMEARYLKAYASQTTNDIVKGLQGLIDVADGFMKEFTSTDGKEAIDNIIGQFDTTGLNQIAKTLGEGGKQIGNMLSKIDTTQVNNIVTGLAAMGAALTGNTLTNEDVEQLKKNISKENIEQLKNSITKEDIEALKQCFTAEDIKKLKESLSAEEIQRLKNAFNEMKE